MVSPEVAEQAKNLADRRLYEEKLDRSERFIEEQLIKGERTIRIHNDCSIFKVDNSFMSKFEVVLDCWDSLYGILVEAGWKPRLTIYENNHWLWGSSHYLEIKF